MPAQRLVLAFFSVALLLFGIVDADSRSGFVRAEDGPTKKEQKDQKRFEWNLNNKKDGTFKKTGLLRAPSNDIELSMEVNALRTLYLFRGTDPSLGTQDNPDRRLLEIEALAKKCAQEKPLKAADAVSPDYRKLLEDLRLALIMEDGDKIADLDDKLSKMPAEDLDDAVVITDNARDAIRKAFVGDYFNADQIAAYLGAYGKDLPNPKALLIKTMRIERGKVAASEKPSPNEWKLIRDFTIDECSWQLSMDLGKAADIAKDIGDLLDKAYAMNDAVLKQNADDLRKEVVAIVKPGGKGKAGNPFELIRTVIQHDVAELLSNPRTADAAHARRMYVLWKKWKETN